MTLGVSRLRGGAQNPDDEDAGRRRRGRVVNEGREVEPGGDAADAAGRGLKGRGGALGLRRAAVEGAEAGGRPRGGQPGRRAVPRRRHDRSDLLRPPGAGHTLPDRPRAPERAAGRQDHPAAEPLLPTDPHRQAGGKGAEEFRNPKASLRLRLCDLLSHLQHSGERDCQEFYRALYIHAQPLHGLLPSRQALQNSDCTELDWGRESHELSDRGPMSFLAGLGLAAGLALLLYCCPPDSRGLPGARRLLGFSPVIIDRHVSRYLLAFLADDLGGL